MTELANWSDPYPYPSPLGNFSRKMAAVVNLPSAITLGQKKGRVLAKPNTLGMGLPAVATSTR